MQITERIAGGGLVSLVGGFFIAVALATSAHSRSVLPVLIWLVTVICSGVVVSSTDRDTPVKDAAFPALVVSTTPVIYLCFVLVIAITEEVKASASEIPWNQWVIDHLNPSFIATVLVVWAVCFSGSLVVIIMSMIASRLVLASAQKLYEFGPQGVNRVKLVILGVVGVLAAVLSLLAMLGK